MPELADADRMVRWAFAAATGRFYWGRNRKPEGWREPGLVLRQNGVTVYRSARCLPYGESTHARGYLTHIADAVYTAWRGGRLVGQMVRWWCSSTTTLFRLAGEASGPLCPVCVVAVTRAGGVAG
jgi:hypothetical protein